MTTRDYVLDRLPLLLAFGTALLLLLLVVHLGVRPLSGGEVGYIALLAAVATVVILGVDYQRHKVFRREVARRLAQADNSPAPLPSGASREQRAMAALLAANQAEAAGELQRHRTAAEHHRTFTDMWVHQMKTPLAVLELTVAQQLAHDAASTESEAGGTGSDAWRSVAEEVESLTNGLELMLTTARLERFELDVHPVSTDLGALARTAVNDLKRSWIRAGVYPRIDAPPVPVTVETDPKWLQVVLRQLLTNAIKYSNANGTVTITVEPHAHGARLSVTDTGIGIPAEDVPRVFERFYTGVNGRRSKASTGMGLYLAAEISRRLGHTLTLESTVGQGTNVQVTLTPRALHRLGPGEQLTA